MRALALLLLMAGPAAAVPVVPNFRSGTTTSHTESTTQMVEQIKSVNYATGYTYSVSGTGVTSDGALIPKTSTPQLVNMEGVQSQWQGLPLEQKPTYQQQTQGASFQLTESYMGPGLQSITTITRTVESSSVTDTTSVFGQ